MVYNTSVDVPLFHWTSADTLFYPISVAEESNIKHPIRTSTDYHVRLSVRHSSRFPLTHLPALICLQQTDTVLGHYILAKRLMQKPISPQIRNDQGQPLGSGWGSLYEYQQMLPDISVRFSKPGTYRLLIIPRFDGAEDGIDGMASVGLELYE